MPRRTALIVPVPCASHLVETERNVPAHVTILFPFLPFEEISRDELERLFGGFAAFDFALDRAERWPHAVVLLPTPSEPFVELTHAVWRRWPDHPPYEGSHDVVIPHLTVAVDHPPLTLRDRATEVLLLEEEEPGGRFATLLRFALAG